MLKRINPLFILIGLSILSIIAYLFFWLLTQSYRAISLNAILRITQRRSLHLIAMIVSSTLIAFASLSFQTLTQNRILTPSVLGFDSLFSATQTFVLFIFGANSILLSNPVVNFGLTSTIMILVSLILYGYLLKKYSRQIAFLLLFGLVISTLLRSSSSFIQILLNPDEFQSLVALTTVSISNIDANLILWIIPFMIILIILFYRKSSQYDVMALGRDSALSLGLDYDKTQRTTLITLSAAMAISTALVGPMTFLGLIAVNSARELLNTYKHTQLFVTSSLLSIVMLVLGQLIIEQIGFITSVTVLLNLVGGIYLIYLILKEGQL
jgi:iron complex transport system permease protein